MGINACATADELLMQYLSAGDELTAQETLAQLMQVEVQPRIRRVVAGRLSPWNSESHDVDDVCGDAVVVLLGRLRAMRDSQEGEIAHIGGYAAAVAHQMVAEYLRRKYPLRHPFQNRVRYALNHTPGLATWNGPDGELLCGREQWMRVESAAPSQEYVDRWAAVYAQIIPNAAYSPVTVVIHRILDYLSGAVEIETLVSYDCARVANRGSHRRAEARVAYRGWLIGGRGAKCRSSPVAGTVVGGDPGTAGYAAGRAASAPAI